MSWNPPPNGQAGMVQRPPMPGPPLNHPTTGLRGPPLDNQPPKSYGQSPQVGQFASPHLAHLNPGTQRLPMAPPRHNGPPPSVQLNSQPPRPENLDSSRFHKPPTDFAAASASELLPAPYHGKGIYTHNTHVGPPPQNLTPTNSEPSSLNTSRVPSPIPNQQFDALEGQFRSGTPGSNRGTPLSGSPVPQATPSPRSASKRPVFPPATNNMNGVAGQVPVNQPSLSTLNSSSIQAPPIGLTPMSHAQTMNLPPASGTLAQPQINLQPGQLPGQPQLGTAPQMGHPRFGAPPVTSAPLSTSQMEHSSFQPPVLPGSYRPTPPPGHYPQPGPNPQHPGTLGAPQHPGTLGAPQLPGTLGAPQSPAPPNSYQQPGLPPHPGMPHAAGQYNPPSGAPIPPQPANSYNLNASFGSMGLNQQPRQVPAEMRTYNLLQERNILPAEAVVSPVPNLPEHLKKNNCSPGIFRCTLTCMPQSNSLLQKSRLPLGILIHPFKDLSHLPVIQSSVIVRCRSCRTYINPFVSFIDQRRWRCNLCYRANELPEEFNFDPVSKSYGSPERRPEIKAATIEFVAPSEYMLRPPQPCVYLFLLDVSYHALQSGSLQSFCEVLAEELDKLPGDSRTLVGFISYNSSVHFYNLSDSLSTPQIHVVTDIDDIFLPLPDGLLANLQASRSLIEQLLQQLPTYHQDEFRRDDSSAMGAALQAAIKLATATGGRITVLQTSLPSVGPGKLENREDPNQRASNKPAHLQPATDFYKQLSLEAAGQQIAIDLFLFNHQYADYATIGGVARHSGGCIYAYPGLHATHNPAELERFEQDLRRYLVRKIGLEAVMRVRCTKGLSIHTFHGNFFVRSTDLLSLPNINPDAGFGMQVSIEDNLTESPYACMQAALLYTSSKGERRIRVHTLCLPVSTSLTDVINGADQQAIVSMLSKMAVDRSQNSAVADAREALVNACVDALGAYGSTLTNQQRMGTVPAPHSLRLLPLYVSALLKHTSIRTGVSTKVDDRISAMDRCKTLPLSRLLQELLPDLYPIHALTDEAGLDHEETIIPQPPRLPANSCSIDRHGAFILDAGSYLYMWIGSAINPEFCAQVFGKPDFGSIPDGLYELPELENETSDCYREDSRNRQLFTQYMVEDKTESSMSYYEFLQHIQKLLKSS
ncbi:protein transport protein Sec24A-like isoform X2 [Watersipora subatra]|uniref:protein transport protein Sec24A-like isoform X2 n=1 Tax=Watersipora subatra TaxID=2589382 RepID=UPI00355C2BA0